jgi:O-antigen ligase
VNRVSRERIAKEIGAISFYSLLILIALVAVPYGAAEPWWKAFFQCIVFALAGLCVIERLLLNKHAAPYYSLLLPAIALIAFAFLQTVPWSHYSTAGIDNVAETISADASQTRLFISQFGALVLAGVMLVVHTNSHKRLRLLIDLIVAVGVISAGFGLLRQATQVDAGFLLPYLRPHSGYAQFINRDHFAFLIEMALGLTLGITVCRGASGSRLALYLIAAIPMWIALVLANSRGGILSMLGQVLMLAWLLGWRRTARQIENEQTPAHPGIRLWRKARSLAARAILIIALFAAAVIGVIFVGGDPLVRKLDAISIELDPKIAASYTLRLNIWQATRELIKDHPVAGVGFGGYWIAISKYHHSTGEITPQQAHSDYLELMASGGVIGLGVGIWFIIAFARHVRRKLMIADNYERAVTLGALVGIVTVAIHSLVDFGLHVTINALLFTALISIALIKVKSNSAETVK